MGLQHMLELRREKDGFVNVNSVYLIVMVKNQYSKSRRKTLDCSPDGFAFYFALI